MAKQYLEANHPQLLKNQVIQGYFGLHARVFDEGCVSVVARKNGVLNVDSAANVWRAAGVPEQSINALITSDSQWKYKIDPHTLLNAMAQASPQELVIILTHYFRPTYAPVQKTLDYTASIPEYGFNSHEMDSHILILIGRLLSNEFPISVLEKKLIILTLFIHDLGNSLNRSAHSIISLSLANLIINNFSSMTELKDVPDSVIFHDESFFNPELRILIEESLKESDPTAAFLEKFSQKFTSLASVVWILDKTDVGRNRLMNSKWQVNGRLPEGVLLDPKDPHFFYNSCWEYLGSGIDKKNPQVFACDFGLQLHPDDQVITEDHNGNVLTKASTEKRLAPQQIINVPPYIRERYKLRQIPYLHSIALETLRLYKHRMLGIVPHAFNLNPDITTVVLRFNDGMELQRKDGTALHLPTIELEFDRSKFVQQMLLCETKLDAIELSVADLIAELKK